ncbi:5'-3' exonuclease, alpha-helical arch, N-terminal [uncultured Caudovirales phage]|uniref:5'-3' exonuclease, alpha-helical arch, N-terminal n=1 Tax=uncultured Caudovirales phage TaxID=2100421 RepID=A0A6J5NJM8_9CAUD|nr:5'-3' exonuclease, alpha-helical arch, N-terminal [uncultured Caudovirales phage]
MDLIIDGNAFINVAISVTKSLSSKDKRTGDAYYVNDLFNDGGFMLKEHVKISFRNFCFTYLNSIISPIPSSPEKIHIVFDSSSWRKEYTTKFFKNAEFKTTSAPVEFKYKGNRRYDDHQYLFFEYFQHTIMPALVSRCGLNQYKFKGTEGDDIIAYLCDIIKGDILIYSVDQDLKQLTGHSDKNVLLITPKQMAKTKRLFVPSQIIPTAANDEVDNFFSLNDAHITGATIEKMISNLTNKDYVEHKVDFIDETLSKILLGDKSDNIPKLTSISPLKAKKVILAVHEKFGDEVISLLDDLDNRVISKVVDEIKVLNKIKDQDKLDEIREHLLFNIKLTRLSVKVFPDEIRSTLDDFFNSYSSTVFNQKEFNNLKNNLSSL